MPDDIDYLLKQSRFAFENYRNSSLKERAVFLQLIASLLIENKNELIHTAHSETSLPEQRLNAELQRTAHQLNSYSAITSHALWMDVRIDESNLQRNLPQPDLRKMMVAIGPVLVFGAANFPFAYSTAGGDTASALAAGCSVIVKAHPAHPETGNMVAGIISTAIKQCNLPEHLFTHIHGDYATGEALVKHPLVKAVGFTGSYAGGKQLFDWAQQRPEPIPVFAEMSSVNPIFLLPEKLLQSAENIAVSIAESITLGVGQFCTNPGIIVFIRDKNSERFIRTLVEKINDTASAPMLHNGIVCNYEEKKQVALSHKNVTLVAQSKKTADTKDGIACIALTDAETFINHPLLQQEVFGPFSILIECENIAELINVAKQMKGQLTTTIYATTNEIIQLNELKYILQDKCGRFIFNGVPTGVEVSGAMQHGGPFPSTTDSRFTAVGPDSIKRFVRPICFQNWPNELLPDALKNENPLELWRLKNNEWEK